MRLEELSEDAFLRELSRRFPPSSANVVLGIGDDAAVVEPPPGERILLTTDALIEGVHFSSKWMPPRFVGRKAVAVAASDIAAMGGQPLAVLLSMAVPRQSDVESLFQIVEAVQERASELGMSLVGGNVASSPGGMVVDVTVMGATLGKRALLRAGANAGDGIYLSGVIGAAAAGLELLERGAVADVRESSIRAQLDPEPRIELGKELNRGELASACIDVSDGLALDLHRLCRASGLGARIHEAWLPILPGVATDAAIRGGEDYELLFASAQRDELEQLRARLDLPITRIGEMIAGGGVELSGRDGDVRRLSPAGWDHFSQLEK
jgi:thiamine-monophosphate kinase